MIDIIWSTHAKLIISFCSIFSRICDLIDDFTVALLLVWKYQRDNRIERLRTVTWFGQSTISPAEETTTDGKDDGSWALCMCMSSGNWITDLLIVSILHAQVTFSSLSLISFVSLFFLFLFHHHHQFLMFMRTIYMFVIISSDWVPSDVTFLWRWRVTWLICP